MKQLNVTFSGEGNPEIRKITFKELHDKVAVYAEALRRLGIEKGDRVVGMSCKEELIIHANTSM